MVKKVKFIRMVILFIPKIEVKFSFKSVQMCFLPLGSNKFAKQNCLMSF